MVPLPVPTHTQVPPLPKRFTATPTGTWERAERGNKRGRIVFASDGSVVLTGALESSSPGHWDLAPLRHELYLTLPKASDETVAIFAMYLKEGVKAVDRPNQRITYTFDEETDQLNIAGWIYTKVILLTPSEHAHQEPND